MTQQSLSISRDGTEIGEWTEEQVRAFYKEGRLVATDNYWKEGMTEWESLVGFINPPPAFPPPPFPNTASIEIESSPPVLPPALPIRSGVTTASKVKKKRDWNKESMGCLGLLGTFILLGIFRFLQTTYLMPAVNGPTHATVTTSPFASMDTLAPPSMPTLSHTPAPTTTSTTAERPASLSGDNISLGNASVVLPAPDNYYRCDGKDKDMDKVLQAMAPPTTRVLAVYCNEKDLANLFAGQFPDFDRVCDAGVGVSSQNTSVTDQSFDEEKQLLKAQFSTHQIDDKFSNGVNAEAQRLSKSLGAIVTMKAGDVVQLGVFDETPESICMTMLLKATVKPDASPIVDVVKIESWCIVHVQKRRLLLFVTATYHNEEDFTWTRTELKKWRDAIVAANPPQPTPPAP